MDKENLRAISSLDQATAHFGNFSKLLFSYQKSLNESGFTRKESLELVKKLQDILFSQAFNSPAGNENGDEEDDEDDED